MRKGIKIAILVVACSAVLIAILIFIKTVVDPPIPTAHSNVHVEAIEKAINSFNKLNKSLSFDDSLYIAVNSKIILFHKEKFISDDQRDIAINNLVYAYVPIFKDECYIKFNKSKWYDRDHNKMINRIKDLRALRINDGSFRAVTGKHESDLQNIESIIQNYREAQKVARNGTFTTVKNAKENIDKANRFISMPYISNCTDLVNRLNNVKTRISESHYQYLTNQVYNLSNYYSHNKESYAKLVTEVLSMLDSYVSMKNVYGYGYKDISTLKTKVGNYELEAYQYFNKPSITIDNNSGSWISIASPHSGYNAYMSYSNYHRPNTNTSMSFTIKGYSQFTFYIRSNGEANYDFVMVGNVNSMPTRLNNYVNTSGKQNSGSTFNSYTPVTFSNLNKSSSYTIYVVYTKDSSGDAGSDRGYVLIPRP